MEKREREKKTTEKENAGKVPFPPDPGKKNEMGGKERKKERRAFIVMTYPDGDCCYDSEKEPLHLIRLRSAE